MKVYIVTTGQYSDYTIEGACSTRELAETAAEHYSYANVEEFEVDADFTKGQVHIFRCFLTADGDLRNEDNYWTWDDNYKQRGGLRLSNGLFRAYSKRNAEDARRLAAEARTQYLQEKP